MGSAAGQAIYSQFSVFKKDRDYSILTGLPAREIDIKGKVVGFNYYESLYSPMVTASFVELDTGGTVGDIEDDFAGTFKDGLKIEGFEKVKVQVRTSYSSVEWDLDNRQFVITGSPYNVDTSTKQSAYFPMVSVNAITEISVKNAANAMYTDTQKISKSDHNLTAIVGAKAPPTIAPN